jgi:hypothetical protein
MWPSSGRCITKDGYIKPTKVGAQMHRHKILNFINTWFNIHVKNLK